MSNKKFKKVDLKIKWLHCFDTNDQFLKGNKDEIAIILDNGDKQYVLWASGKVAKDDKKTINVSKTIDFEDDTSWTISVIEVDHNFKKYYDSSDDPMNKPFSAAIEIMGAFSAHNDEIGSVTFTNNTTLDSLGIRRRLNKAALKGTAWMDGSGAKYRLKWEANPTYVDE